jgi:hypothetical protein
MITRSAYRRWHPEGISTDPSLPVILSRQVTITRTPKSYCADHFIFLI